MGYLAVDRPLPPPAEDSVFPLRFRIVVFVRGVPFPAWVVLVKLFQNPGPVSAERRGVVLLPRELARGGWW